VRHVQVIERWEGGGRIRQLRVLRQL